jgi:hypothetical protein
VFSPLIIVEYTRRNLTPVFFEGDVKGPLMHAPLSRDRTEKRQSVLKTNLLSSVSEGFTY